MHKIMFVCHGNICRSPMAEFLMKDAVRKLGREEEFKIASCAVSDEEVWNGIGNPVYPPVKKLLAEKGISCEGKRACVLTAADGEAFDLFLCMDDSNLRRAKGILGVKNAEKCQKLLAFAGDSGNVADPWYTRDFQAAYKDIMRGIEGLLQSL
jgi:protein-tyrosine phosphatase